MINGRIICTVNTDASFNSQRGTGGYAIWIRCDEVVVKYWGQFQGKVSDSNECEIKAVVNALSIVLRHNIKCDAVCINCDNSTLRNAVNHKQVPKRFETEIQKLHELMDKFDKVYAKTIKGHTNKTSPRDYVNRWCDEMSREYLKHIKNE